jgi:hypothetical protein
MVGESLQSGFIEYEDEHEDQGDNEDKYEPLRLGRSAAAPPSNADHVPFGTVRYPTFFD